MITGIRSLGEAETYKQLLGLQPEVPVEAGALVSAGKLLWKAIMQNIRQPKGSISEDNRLNPNEIKWLAPLCGIRLVPDHEQRQLNPHPAEPSTLTKIEIELRRFNPPIDSAAVEKLILAGCRKLMMTVYETSQD